MSGHSITIQQYLADLVKVIDQFPEEQLNEIISVLEHARDNDAHIFICGNGGSWATAAHMVCDFGKNTRSPGTKHINVFGLGDNIPSLTAYANDEGYDQVFAEQLISFMKSSDVLIAISGSGNSPNILRAVETAKSIGGITIGLTGFEGGRLISLVDYCLVVPSDSIEIIEDCHMIVDHLLTICLRK
jgi:D-sedoheptulose 7-phosphate isomerase